MATTTIQPLPYPLPGDPADGPAQIKALAEAVEGRTVMRFASLAARDAALPSGTLVDGMMCHVASENAVYLRSGGAWRLVWRDTGWQNVPLDTGYTGAGLQYRVIGPTFYMRGAVTRTAGPFPVGTTAIGTLPVGARPSAFGRWAAAAAPSSAAMTPALQIDAAGAMSVLISGTSVSTAIYVDGVSYPVA